MPQSSLFHLVAGEVRSDLRCTACELCENPSLRTNRMDGVGARNPAYMFVGYAPGEEDDRIRSPFTGNNGLMLKSMMLDAGIPLKSSYFTNCIKCFPDGRNPKERWFKSCSDYLVSEIRRAQPTVIISLGAKSLEWLTGHTGVTRLRRRGLPCILPIGFEVLVFPIRQPVALYHTETPQEREQLRRSMVADLKWMREQVDAGTVQRRGDRPTDYQVARTPEDVDRFFAEFEKYDTLSCDLETGDTAFNPKLFPDKDCRVISIGFSFAEGVGRAIPLYARGPTSVNFWDETYLELVLVPKLAKLLREKTVFGHNFVQFDQKWIRHQFGVQECKVDFDTMYAHYILDEEKGTHGLERLAILFTTMSPWKDTFSLSDTEQMCAYLCRDVDATFRLRKRFEQEMTSLQKWLLHSLLIPVGNVLKDMEFRGIRISEENATSLNSYLSERITDTIAKIRALPPVKHYEIATNSTFNPDSFEQVGVLFEKFLKLPCNKRTGDGKFSTDREVLDTFIDRPAVSMVSDIRRLRKLHSTYCEGLLREIKSDGRLHTTYKLHGTVTGRPASESPNLSNIPREGTAAKVLEDGSAVKALFAATDGHTLLQADYSQMELRVLAALSGDDALRGIYLNDQDAHSATAAKVYGIEISQVAEEQRNIAKTVNFGIVYGMSIESLIQKFIATGSTEQEGRFFHDAHKRMFPKVWRYMDVQEETIRKYGFQETVFGRRRHYDEITSHAIRQAYNFPIQSVASDILLLALVRCDRAFKALGIPAHLLLTVYDSIVFDVPLGREEEVCGVVQSIMEGMSFPWLTVPLKVELKIGPTWGDLKKVSR